MTKTRLAAFSDGVIGGLLDLSRARWGGGFSLDRITTQVEGGAREVRSSEDAGATIRALLPLARRG